MKRIKVRFSLVVGFWSINIDIVKKDIDFRIGKFLILLELFFWIIVRNKVEILWWRLFKFVS